MTRSKRFAFILPLLLAGCAVTPSGNTSTRPTITAVAVTVPPSTRPTAPATDWDALWWTVKDVTEKYAGERWGAGAGAFVSAVAAGLGFAYSELQRRRERRALYTRVPAAHPPKSTEDARG